MNADFTGELQTTGIGSLPRTDPQEAVSFVLEAELSIPFWPQLPRRSYMEGMVAQFSEHCPAVTAEPEEGVLVWSEEQKYSGLEPFYQRYLAEDPSLFALSRGLAAGFEAFLERAEEESFRYVKGQLTGPITFTTSITDENGDTLYSDPELRDAVVKMLCRNAEWQVQRLSPLAEEGVVVFVDEPVLAVYGSSALSSISEEGVHGMEGQIFQAIREAGGVSGIHVCGNSDWGVVSNSGVQLLNFDAYQYGQTIALYPDEVAALLQRGGCIAWGIVPTTNAIRDEDADSLAHLFEQCVAALSQKGFERAELMEHSLLTPSCGAGSLPPGEAGRVFEALHRLANKLRG
ncbi:MAG: hypothetical protein PVJ27_05590 [Candidatus Brocadiaceae bacterium]|jgi:hypothetical protein